MISKDNLKQFLQLLGFEQKQETSKIFSNFFSKYFSKTDTYLKVDLDKQQIIYPEDKGLIVNEKQICNFSQNENFVVLECVNRLLEKGYKPEHLEIEPRWQLGHGASGGRADILLKDNNNKPLLIIECKTAGREFDKEWKNMQIDSGQLFTYAWQISETKYICLYTSELENNKIVFENKIITLNDNINEIEKDTFTENKRKFYKDTTNHEELFEVWKNTYQYDFTETGIFETDIQPYNIGKTKLTLQNLRYITQKELKDKFNEFAEILRMHNVSSKESAFDKLINLFLCKIVDETESINSGKELEFYWRGKYFDDYFSLIDRLQRLYKEGMQEFLGERITHIELKKVEDAFYLFKSKNATKDYVLKLFKQQKYFTNSDFGFIDVHNEKLFFQNAEILLDVIKMWQNYQLNGEQQNQFLGDMFEFFLDKGFKQSEGQFFTPIPICKFILNSLPLENIVYQQNKPPRVIDYACGSGHFLTEYASQIKPFVENYNTRTEDINQHRKLKNYYKNIYGIEKEYRLSKVAKISAFMYGHDEINVIYCDALKNIEQDIKGITIKVEDETCDILVANPPFAVDRFLTTLSQEERKKYLLFTKDTDIDSQRNIQCYFLERAKQLLTPGGVAGIIVPSSVLSNADSVHIATREILLKYFDIISIVELGNGTFGKTGTNTVILFLRRKKNQPEIADHFKNRAFDWTNLSWNEQQNTEEAKEYNDLDIIKKYTDHIEIPFTEYKNLSEFSNLPVLESIKNNDSEEIKELPNFEKLGTLFDNEIFKEYRKDFDNNKLRELQKKTFFKKLEPKEQEYEATRLFIEYVLAIESEKLYYFALAFSNPQKVLIVKNQQDSKDQKNFLGYEWSGAKGSEGIIYKGGLTVYDIQTPMFDPTNRDNPQKINYYISQNFLNSANFNLNADFETVKDYITYVPLQEMFDFKRVNFNKAFSLNVKKNELNIVKSKWELVKLNELIDYLPKSKRKAGEGLDVGEYPFFSSSQIQNKWLNECDYRQDAIILGTGGSASVHFETNFSTSADVFSVISKNEMLIIKYLYYYFQNNMNLLEAGFFGIAIKHISKEYLENIKIPLPDLEIQKQIINLCQDIDNQSKKSENIIKKSKIKISEIINDLHKKDYKNISVENLLLNVEGKLSKIPQTEILTAGKFPVITQENEKLISGYTNVEEPITDLPLIIFGDHSCNFKFIDFPFVRGADGTQLLKVNTEIILPKYFYFVIKTIEITNKDKYERHFKYLKTNKIPVPDMKLQEKLVSEIEKIEEEISFNQNIIASATLRKKEILEKY